MIREVREPSLEKPVVDYVQTWVETREVDCREDRRGISWVGGKGGDEDGQLEFSGYKGNGKGRYRHNRQRLRSDSKFFLKSDAGKDTEGHLERRNDQRPRGLQEEEEWEEWEWGGHIRA